MFTGYGMFTIHYHVHVFSWFLIIDEWMKTSFIEFIISHNIHVERRLLVVIRFCSSVRSTTTLIVFNRNKFIQLYHSPILFLLVSSSRLSSVVCLEIVDSTGAFVGVLELIPWIKCVVSRIEIWDRHSIKSRRRSFSWLYLLFPIYPRKSKAILTVIRISRLQWKFRMKNPFVPARTSTRQGRRFWPPAGGLSYGMFSKSFELYQIKAMPKGINWNSKSIERF